MDSHTSCQGSAQYQPRPHRYPQTKRQIAATDFHTRFRGLRRGINRHGLSTLASGPISPVRRAESSKLVDKDKQPATQGRYYRSGGTVFQTIDSS